MGVCEDSLTILYPAMNISISGTDSSEVVDQSCLSGLSQGHRQKRSPQICAVLDSGLSSHPTQSRNQNKMKWERGSEETTTQPHELTGSYADCLAGGVNNLTIRNGINNEFSASLPNLTSELDTEVLNNVNERNVRSSLTDIYAIKHNSCSLKMSVNELTQCFKTLRSDQTPYNCDNVEITPQPECQSGRVQTRVRPEEITIEMNGESNRLSAVLENIPLFYLPHTKQLVSVSPQEPQGETKFPTDPKNPCSERSDNSPSKTKLKSCVHNSHGDSNEASTTSFENGLSLKLNHSFGFENSPNENSSHLCHPDSSFEDANQSRTFDPDGTLALSQDSDASSTCKSDLTVIHHETESSDHEKDCLIEKNPDAQESLNNSDGSSKEGKESPRGSMQRTSTLGSLSKADASSFSSISSLSTATDFSLSAASCSDDYIESKTGGDVDEAGFMEVSLHSRNTFERSKDSSQDSGIDEKQCPGAKAKRKGISSFFARSLFSRKPPKDVLEPPSEIGPQTSSLNNNAVNSAPTTPTNPGWKLFGRVPQKNTAHIDAQEGGKDLQCKSKSNIGRAKKPDVEAPSTTALILENRPSHLPSKDPEEELRHKIEYEAMVEASKKRELREAKLRKKREQQRHKQEEALAAANRVWNNDILPNWDTSKCSKKARELWWQGIPPAVRGKVWQLAIGNDLNLTPELYEICLNRAKDRLKLMEESGDTDSICSQVSEHSSSKEASVEVIKLDVSRTFPQLCIFQKRGPYNELLQGLLGAYACYRPDVGYVQGMSFIAAVLLLNMEVNDAFICFANLLNRPCQIAFFRLDESLMKSYFSAYEEFFNENLPKLYSHFQKQGLSSDLYIIDWMFTLYAKSLPLDVASRVWDVFCRDGEEFLFRTALGILKLYEDILLSLDFIHLAQFLTKLPDTISSEQLFRAIDSVNMAIDKKRFAQILALFREPKET